MNQASLFCLSENNKMIKATFSKFRQYIFTLSSHHLIILNNYVGSTGRHEQRPNFLKLFYYVYFLFVCTYVGHGHATVQDQSTTCGGQFPPSTCGTWELIQAGRLGPEFLLAEPPHLPKTQISPLMSMLSTGRSPFLYSHTGESFMPLTFILLRLLS